MFRKIIIYFIIFNFVLFSGPAFALTAEDLDVSQSSEATQENQIQIDSELSSNLAEESAQTEAGDVGLMDEEAESEKTLDEQASIEAESEKDVKSKSTMSSASSGEKIPFSTENNILCPNCSIKQANGSLNYEYNFFLPPGRNGLQPKVGLRYSQFYKDTSSLVGNAWQLDFAPYIERSGRKGSDKMYSLAEFNFFNNSSVSKIVPINLNDEVHGIYGKEVEDDFVKIEFLNNNSWLATDKSGTKYYFGFEDQSRQNDPANQSKIYKWLLEKIEDINGNSIKYYYFKDSGQIYPKEIKYTNRDEEDGIYSVRFEPFYSGDLSERPDRSISYKPGFQVDTKYRLEKISVAVNSEIIKKYNLGFINRPYTKIYNLKFIEEVGYRNGEEARMPKVEFGYELNENDLTSWNYDENIDWEMPQCTLDRFPFVFNEDINNDGLVDRICSNDMGNYQVFINSGIDSFAETSSDWKIPAMGGKTWYYNNNPKYAFLDINGDRLKDILVYFFAPYEHDRYTKVYLHNGKNGWEESDINLWKLDGVFASEKISIDINNDGFQDFISGGGASQWHVFLYNGINGWEDVTNWGNNVWQSFPGYGLIELSFPDINNDGMADAMFKSREPWLIDGDWHYQKAVYLYNNKNGFEEVYNRAEHKNTINNYNWEIPEFGIGYSDSCMSVGSGDVNSDGLGEISYYNWYQCSLPSHNYINNGVNGWEINPGGPRTGRNGGVLPSFDINNDGWVDYYEIVNEPDRKYDIYINQGDNSFFLNSISNNQGGEVKIEYQNAKSFLVNGELANKGMLDWDKFLVKNITYYDQGEDVMSNDYFYEGGAYLREDPSDNYTMEFAGFSKVVETNDYGDKIINYYHQGNDTSSSTGEYMDHFSKKGRAYRTEIYDSSDNLYQAQINKWEKTDLPGDRYFVKLTQAINMSYDGQFSHRDKAVSYDYDDTNGNLIKQSNWGEVIGQDDGSFSDIGDDYFEKLISYSENEEKYILDKPRQEIIQDKDDNKLRENKYYYDNLAWGEVSQGNLTKTESWLEGEEYISAQKEYNDYGLVTKEIDPKGNATKYVYDEYNLYPSSAENALGQITQFEYDYASGQVSKATDPNGIISANFFDGLGRTRAIKHSSYADKNNLVTISTIEYDDFSTPRQIKQTDYLSETQSITSYTYLDGLNRTIQTKRQAEVDNQFIAQDFSYNKIGLLEKESLPYFSTGAENSVATDNDKLYSFYTYDPLQRVKTAVNAVGATINSYNHWSVETIDPLTNKKVFYNDAYGNLVKVKEYNWDEIYTTEYNYDLFNNLTKITDALGNIRNFTYDNLGRLVYADDLHAADDTAFGEYFYDYDDNGNLIEKQDAKKQIIKYDYDELNRVKSEDFLAEEGIELNYVYDSCLNGIGRLCEAIQTDVQTEYEYNNFGLAEKEIKKFNNFNNETIFSYDYQGNVFYIVYPDNTEIAYEFNQAGQVEKVFKKDSQDANFIPVVEDIDYNPLGQVEYQNQANGTETNYVYNADELYRLKNKVSLDTKSSLKLQDLSYEFDAVGNIKKIIDNSDTDTKKTSRFDYDDLYRLTSASTTEAVSGENYSRIYSYNAIGNILHKSDQGDYIYNQKEYANPHAVTQVGETNYSYDKNGNMISDNGWSHNWDYNNRLASSANEENELKYIYDHAGSRAVKISGEEINYYINQYYEVAGADISTSSSAQGEIRKHIYANGEKIATIIDRSNLPRPDYCEIPAEGDLIASSSCILRESARLSENLIVEPDATLTIPAGVILEMDLANYNAIVKNGGGLLIKNGGTLRSITDESFASSTTESLPAVFMVYHHTDHLSGSSVDTDENGNILELVDYYPFGETRLDKSSADYENNYKFTGKELDEDTGLYYYGARYYDAGIGRFVSVDPLVINLNRDWLSDPQKLNSYSYVYNNPLRYTDSTGEYGEDVHFDLTYYLGRMSGLNLDQSAMVAIFDQFTDEDSSTKPTSLKNLISGSTIHYHFNDRLYTLNEINNVLNSDKNANEKILDFATLLHTFQDTYSHEGLNPFTHVLYGHDPDKTYLDPAKALEMAKNSFLLLRKLNADLNGTNDLTDEEYSTETQKIWSEIESNTWKYIVQEDKGGAQVTKENKENNYDKTRSTIFK